MARFRGRPAKKAPAKPDPEKAQAAREAKAIRAQRRGAEVARISRVVTRGERQMIMTAMELGHAALPLCVNLWVSIAADPRAPMTMRMRATENLGDRCGLPRRSDVPDPAKESDDLTFQAIADGIRSRRALQLVEANPTDERESVEAETTVATPEPPKAPAPAIVTRLVPQLQDYAGLSDEQFFKLVQPVEIPEDAPPEEEHRLVMQYLKSLLCLPVSSTEEAIRSAIIVADAKGDIRGAHMHAMFLAAQNRLHDFELEDRGEEIH